MNQKLLQEVAHLLRKYYDDRGAKLEQYAEQIIKLCDDLHKNEQLILELNKASIQVPLAHNQQLIAGRALGTDWELYKKYIADEIEYQVNKKFNTIRIYTKEN